MSTIDRQAAIDYCYALINAENPSDPSDEWNYSQERINQTEVILHHLEFMPSAQPDVPDTNVGDMISRQAAMDEWKNDFKGYVNALNIPKDDYNGIMEYIDELPSAQPERKTGHWKFDWRHDKATCSECGHTFRCVFDIDNFDNFCRHCGAKMEDSR